MRGLSGFLGGGLALIALQTVVANEGAAQRAGGLFDLAGELARRVVDPTVPAFGAAPLSQPKPADPKPGEHLANRDYPSPALPPLQRAGQPI